ncbi:gamma-glutamylcyclotransferase [Kitasatospora sp. NBC_01560]|uniref:gamma-glutamylcyclotransferase family protein n=1 Tax=Kitasatospora sp. NBC_01560 TaxID=2975965 RepID=UPI0038661039
MARLPAGKLTLFAIAALVMLAASIAALQDVTTVAADPLSKRFALNAFFTRTSAMLRALINTGAYPASAGHNDADEAISFVVGVLSLLIPALVVATFVIRVFAVDPFVWRKTTSLCFPWEMDYEPQRADSDSNDIIVAIRWYKRLRRLTINDLTAKVFLHYVAPSPVDGTITARRVQLDVLDGDGNRAQQRTWPIARTGAPFTLWVPLDAPLTDGEIRHVQGRDITGLNGRLVIQLRGEAVGLATAISGQQWYQLGESEGTQIGRFAGVEIGKDVAKGSRGWKRFEDPLRWAVFVYGSLVDTTTLAEYLGRPLAPDLDYVPAKLSGYRRTWSVATDNTDDRAAVVYLTPDRTAEPPVQVLFLDVEEDASAAVEGVLVMVTSEGLDRLRRRERNYEVFDVTARCAPHSTLLGGAPDRVVTFRGRPAAKEAAARGIATGTACIRAEYLQSVERGMGLHGDVVISAFAAEPLPAPIRELLREKRPVAS